MKAKVGEKLGVSKLPKTPEINLPSTDVNMPAIPGSDISLPSMPDVNTGQLAGLDLPEMPALAPGDFNTAGLSPDLGKMNESLPFGKLEGLNGIQDKIGDAAGSLKDLSAASQNVDKLVETGAANLKEVDALKDVSGGLPSNEVTKNAELLKDPAAKLITDVATPNGNSHITYNHLNLVDKVVKSNGEYLKYIYDATGRKLSQVVYNASNVQQKKTDYAGEFIYETITNGTATLQFINHEEGRIIPSGNEYQYHIKDHLGNVRLTFTTKDVTEAPVASLEPANAAVETANFLRIVNARKVQYFAFDRTNGISPTTTTGYAERLSGGTNEKYGLARSLSVMPGDKVTAEVYAKYIDPVSGNRAAALNTFLGQVTSLITAGTTGSGTVIDGGSFSSSTSSFPFPTQASSNTGGSSGTGPKAYLNWLVFDRDYNWISSKSGYKRISSTPKEVGQDVDHELLFSPEISIDVAGYVYVFLSNEEATPIDVYFDDFKVTQVKSPVVQMDDYYPFGLTFNSFSRENSVKQDYKYNGKEMQDELNLVWLDYGARMYMPEMGRWGVVDGMSEKFYEWTVYKYVVDNPVNVIDPDGNCEKCLEFLKSMKDGALNYVPAVVENLLNRPAQLKEGYKSALQGDLTPALKMAAEGSLPGIVVNQLANSYNTAEKIANGDVSGVGEDYGSHLASAFVVLATEGATGALKTTATNKVTVYRGVNENHPGFSAASKGKAVPRGGNATPAQHNRVTTESEFTSWSVDPRVAQNYALRPGGSGIMMEVTVPANKIITSPNNHSVVLKQSGTRVSESEVLLKGKVSGAKTTSVTPN